MLFSSIAAQFVVYSLVSLGIGSNLSTAPASKTLMTPAAGDPCVRQAFGPAKYTPVPTSTSNTVIGDFNGDGIDDIAEKSGTASTLAVQFGEGDGYFGAPQFIDNNATGGFNLALGDFNNDGFQDLFTPSKVYFGDGSGGFVARSISIAPQGSGFVAADLDGDDNMDVAATIFSNGGVEVFFGDGEGNFGSGTTFLMGGSATSLQLTDLNGDGIDDIAVILSNQNEVSVLLGNPARNFSSPTIYPIGGSGAVSVLATGDLDGDDDTDILASSTAGFMAVLKNNGAGAFTVEPRFDHPYTGINRLFLEEVDGNPGLDIVATVSFGRTLSVRTGNNDGTFGETSYAPAPFGVSGMVLKDFTGDGVTDIGMPNSSLNVFTVLENDGAAGFAADRIVAAEGLTPATIDVADMNGDTFKDIVVGSDPNDLRIKYSDGAGGYSAETVIPIPFAPKEVIAADADSDGDVDIMVFVHQNGAQASTAFMIYSNGDGTFQPGISSPVPILSIGSQVAFGDLNNDGRLDLAVPSAADQRVILYEQVPSGQFVFRRILLTNNAARSAIFADFDNDGFLDIVGLAFSAYVYMGNGTFNPDPIGAFPTGEADGQLLAEDLNKDGFLDLIASGQRTLGAGSLPGQIAVLIGQGKGGFSAPAGFPAGRGAKAMRSGDFDGDGNIDVAVVNEGTQASPDNRVSVLYGDGLGALGPRRIDSLGGVGVRDLAVLDANADGRSDLITADTSFQELTVLDNRCLPEPPANLIEISAGPDISTIEDGTEAPVPTVNVSLSMPSAEVVRVRYRTAPKADILSLDFDQLITASGGRDYERSAGELVFQPGETEKMIPLTIKPDLIDEYDEEFSVFLYDASNAVISDRQAAATILDNDDPPVVTVGDNSIAEGNTGTVGLSIPVSLSAASGKAISFNYLTGGGTAIPGQDYDSAQGTVSIPPGQTSGSITVMVRGDLAIEPDETFRVQLRDAVNVTLSGSLGTGTILNDDAGGTVAFSSATYNVAEGQQAVGISVVRTGGNGGGATVRFRTVAGTATPNEDFPETITTLYFGENETNRNVFIPIYYDNLDEPTETFEVVLDQPNEVTIGSPGTATVSIQNVANVPNLSVSDASVVEGDNGTTYLRFFVRLDRPTQRPVTLDFATSDGNATAGVDYGATSGPFTVRPGITRASIYVPVYGDFLFELDETLQLDVSNVMNANATDTQAIGRIINDELNTGSSISLVSLNGAGTGSANTDSIAPSVSFDGNIVAFESFAVDLGPTDANGVKDIYVRNRRLGTNELVSVNVDGTNGGNCPSFRPMVSANGRFVAFESCATDLVPNGQNVESVFVRDLETGETKLASVSSSGAQVEGDIAYISPDGRFVLFQSRAQNVTDVPDSQTFTDIFLRDMQLETTTMVSVNLAGDGPGNTDSGNLTIFEDGVRVSDDGRYVLFQSAATNLVSATHTGSTNVFYRDMQTSTTMPVSISLDGTTLVRANWRSALCSDNDTVAFQSPNSGLVPTDTNNTNDIFLRKMSTGDVTLVTKNLAGTDSANGMSSNLAASADCRFIAFESTAFNLSADPDTNALPDIYRMDMQTGTATMVSVNYDGTNGGMQYSANPRIGADGQSVMFLSAAPDLVAPPTDGNSLLDLFMRDLSTGETFAASANEGGTSTGNLPTQLGTFSRNGAVVVFESSADNLVSNDINGFASDVFAFERSKPGLPLYDFDGDGETDLSVFRPSESVWYKLESATENFNGTQFGLPTDVTVAQDYDGDGKTDIAMFRDGTWYVLRSSDLTVAVFTRGMAGDVPVPGDYDGDKKADPAVFRNGTWEIRESSDGNVRTVQFGIAGDLPVPADFDGDGRTDIAVFRSGNWFILRSTDFGVTIAQFGSAGDIPVEGDFDGDRKADLAIFRPSNGGWYVLSSQAGTVRIVQFGIATDIPMKVDFDSDGKRDLAVYREGVWWILKSSDDSARVEGFGVPGDIPIPRARW